MKWSGYQLSEEDYRRIRPKLRAKAKQMGIPHDELEDVVQESFMEAQKALNNDRFDGRSSLDTWVVAIAKNHILKHWRAKKTEKRSGQEVSIDADADMEATEVPPATEPSPEIVAVGRQQVRRARELLDKLPEKLRVPLLMVANGQKYKEVATALNLTESLVTSRVHQARDQLRKMWPDRPEV